MILNFHSGKEKPNFPFLPFIDLSAKIFDTALFLTMEFRLFNTLTDSKEKFEPVRPGQVDFYSCGPTVYNVIHIGNIRSFLFADTLFRFLTFGLGFKVRWVMNITDIDDKTISGAKKDFPDLDPMEALQKFTRTYEEIFFRDLELMNIRRDSFFQNPRATESIQPMQDLIRKITDAGCAYEQDGSVYFSIREYLKRQKYGTLLRLNLEALKTGTRTLADEIEKENVQDFVLWKARKEGEPSWEFEYFGKSLPGRPGWHIECSAMSKEAFDDLPFDIHSGGVDLKFPHHEDEIAQSTSGYGKPPARFWVHNEHLMVNGAKMSKSLGNFFTLNDLKEKGHSPEVVRFFLVTNHYRTKLNLTEEVLLATKVALQKIRNALLPLSQNVKTNSIPSRLTERLLTPLADDLNAPQALAVLFDVLNDSSIKPEEVLGLFFWAEQIFGVRFLPGQIVLPGEIREMAEKRQKAKEERNFSEADRLREEILLAGFEIRDEKEGYEILPREL